MKTLNSIALIAMISFFASCSKTELVEPASPSTYQQDPGPNAGPIAEAGTLVADLGNSDTPGGNSHPIAQGTIVADQGNSDTPSGTSDDHGTNEPADVD